jgi:hypothetical protein
MAGDKKVKMSLPVFTGALGSTEIARKNWEHFAVGAAISGITLSAVRTFAVSTLNWNLIKTVKLHSAPDMDRRIEIYRRYHRGYGEILVQMNVETPGWVLPNIVSKKHGWTPSN